MHEVVVFVEEAVEGVVVPIGIDKGNRVGCIVALGVEECGCRCHEDGYEQRGGQVVWSRIQGVGGVWLIAEEADEFGCIGFGHGDVVDAWVSDFGVDALGCTPEGAYLAKVEQCSSPIFPPLPAYAGTANDDVIKRLSDEILVKNPAISAEDAGADFVNSVNDLAASY